MNPRTYLFVNAGNDRPNVAQVVRAMEHPMNTHRDLDFLVPTTVQKIHEVAKTFLYCDNIKTGEQIIDYLNARMPKHQRSTGIARPYNASMSEQYRRDVMRLFKAGIVRILVCTDAAGMGCNVPDVDVVVQWKMPSNISSWVQRAGRAARAKGRTGLAVMLVEKSAFEVNTNVDRPANEVGSGSSRGRGRGGGRGRGRGARGGGKLGSEYGVAHGQRRGTYCGDFDEISQLNEPVNIDHNSPGEGMYQYIQNTVCRRRVLTKIFGNPESTVPALNCCDLCNPTLFDRTRPGKPVPTNRQTKIKKREPLAFVRKALYTWRRSVKDELFPRALWAPHALLDDSICELLASVVPITTKEKLEKLLKGVWAQWDTFGDRLFECLAALDIPEDTLDLTVKKRAAPDDLGLGWMEQAGSTSEMVAVKPKRTRTSTGRPRIASMQRTGITSSISIAVSQQETSSTSIMPPTNGPSYDTFWASFKR
ncbi:hypothetical protein H0H93_003957 [Arthromyces matolae]|nr:hypothetical protein H0H93_003957 [Arthromyces matolae]